MMTPFQSTLVELDSIPLECADLTRVIATVLNRDRVPFTAQRGSMWVKGIGHVDPHNWIELETGQIIDFRVRMWLGNDVLVPHGVFLPETHQVYSSLGKFYAVMHPVEFYALTGKKLEHFTAITPPAQLAEIYRGPELTTQPILRKTA